MNGTLLLNKKQQFGIFNSEAVSRVMSKYVFGAKDKQINSSRIEVSVSLTPASIWPQDLEEVRNGSSKSKRCGDTKQGAIADPLTLELVF